ncbi:NfeD family protein [Rhizobium wenxiniae]|uniref:NfeD family protein n=1 Tax=Rhizobium wenxiniae TaxID=1737357 RepID=UPI001C6EDD5D|nr:NfeD family protein [Rhizobium wenxiniae]MBW9091286.1 NfeD family protein [Rhizobium wenxiniae]
MVVELWNSFGPWGWWIIGLVLLVLELLVPGVFLIWIGAAAVVLGALSVALWDAAFWGWHIQLLLFAVLSVLFAVIGRRIYNGKRTISDEPTLNRRGESLVGRTATLSEPIQEGRGRIRLDDTMWSVMGPDLSVGSRVRVVASSGRDLTVEPVVR